MFVWVATNLEHVQNAKAAISVNSPTDPDVLEVVDRYDETTTGYCAARVHDTDLQSALAPGGTLIASAAAVACPAAVVTTVLPLTDVSGYRTFCLFLSNTGANPTTQVHCLGAVTGAGVGLAYNYIHGFATAAGASYMQPMWALYASGATAYGSDSPTPFVRFDVLSTLGTTVSVWLVGKR